MAEIILTPVADLIIQTLSSAAVKKFGALYNVNNDIKELEETLQTIRAVLLDAERQQSHNNQVKLWLQRLEDVMSEADDLFDEVATEGLRRQLMPRRNRVLKNARIFCSSSNPVVFRSKLAGEISRVRKRLAAISADREHFKFEELRVENERAVRIPRETHSYVVEDNVIGRNEEKKRVLKLLLEKNEAEERVRVVSIFGMGGLGKTTLAQLVHNDESLKNDFDFKIWVYVSDNFDEKAILEMIVRSLDNTSTRVDNRTMDEFQKMMREKIRGKRYLLALDNVWSEVNHQKWTDLLDLLKSCGDSRSRIIVTTRSERVARLASKNEAYLCRLGVLSEVDSLSLFMKSCFVQGQELAKVNYLEIGKEIVKKCGGIPLAIRMVASILSVKDPKTEWSSFLKNELSTLPQQQNDILPTLKLSFDYLPSHLKHCFICCRLFPKDYEIYVQDLINLWISQGFVSAYGSQSLEEKGYEQFMELFWRCFFQEVVRDENNKVLKCKMHDLVHDLAIQLAGNKYAILEPGSHETTFENVLHVSYGFTSLVIPDSTAQAKRLRSIFRPTYSRYNPFENVILKAIVSKFKLLRMLDLRCTLIEKVPNSIGKLKHLRYLDLSGNRFKSLPYSFTMLVNLQTLKLNRCYYLRKLPRDMKNLVNLRHLEFNDCFEDKLYQPRGVNQLTNLQTLSYFALPEDTALTSRSSKIDELMGLKNLSGKFEIRGLKSGMKTSGANMKEKENLQHLLLKWSRNSTSNQEPKKTLEGLQPHSNLKSLSVEGYDGFTFSNWLSSLTNLVELQVKDCPNLKTLPSLDSLQSLKSISIDECHYLEYIDTCVKTLGISPTLLPVPVHPSLKKLELKSLFKFRGWRSSNSTSSSNQSQQMPSYFPSLTSLVIDNCSDLTSMPLYPNVWNLKLKSANRKPFEQTASRYREIPLSTHNSFHPLSTVNTLRLSCHSGSYVHLFPFWMLYLSSVETLVISELRRPHSESLIVEYNTSELTYTIGERDERDMLVKKSHTTWNVFSCIHVLVIEKAPISKYVSLAAQHLILLRALIIMGHEEVEISLDNDDKIEWESLRFLFTLAFIKLPNLVALPQWLLNMTTLEKLKVCECCSLETIPESITRLSSLRQLDIWSCPKIESLPGSISNLTSLNTLSIHGCPILLEKCQTQTGEDRPKIQHLRNIDLGKDQRPIRTLMDML